MCISTILRDVLVIYLHFCAAPLSFLAEYSSIFDKFYIVCNRAQFLYYLFISIFRFWSVCKNEHVPVFTCPVLSSYLPVRRRPAVSNAGLTDVDNLRSR